MKGLSEFLSDIVFCLYGSELKIDHEIIESFSNPQTKYLYISKSFECHLAPVTNLALVVAKRSPILSGNGDWSSLLQLIHLPDTQDTQATCSTLSCMVQAMNPILSLTGDSKPVALAKKKCT